MVAVGRFRVLLGILLLVIGGCQKDSGEVKVNRSPLGPIPAYEQRPGDPEAGYQAVVNEAYVTCGIPYSLYARNSGPPDPSRLLPGRKGRNAELPFDRTAYTTPEGVELVVGNCLGCHGAFLNGKLVIGLGNESLDFTVDPSFRIEGLGVYARTDAERREWRKWADIWQAVAPYSLTDTVGVNPAPNLTLALMAHRDPETLAWSQQPRMEPPPRKPLPASVPPWWRLKKKNALYYNTEGRGDHARIMMLGMILCTDDVESARRVDAYAPDIRAYFASIQPPRYPWPVDAPLAEQGRGIFDATCSGCHGTYGEQETYPNLVVGLDVVGTDPEMARVAVDGRSDRFIRWFNRSFFGERGEAAPAPGYNPPPLDGIWATAPFLHNGSVPTLALLLDSRRRPRYWTRSFSSEDYDPQEVGWRYNELEHGKGEEADPALRKKIYDTTLPGYSNQGHTFGDGLTAEQRRALLEYLKTL